MRIFASADIQKALISNKPVGSIFPNQLIQQLLIQMVCTQLILEGRWQVPSCMLEQMRGFFPRKVQGCNQSLQRFAKHCFSLQSIASALEVARQARQMLGLSCAVQGGIQCNHASELKSTQAEDFVML